MSMIKMKHHVMDTMIMTPQILIEEAKLPAGVSDFKRLSELLNLQQYKIIKCLRLKIKALFTKSH